MVTVTPPPVYGVVMFILIDTTRTFAGKIRPILTESIEDSDIPDVTVEFDAKLLNANNFQYLVNLSEILTDSGEIGEMELEIFKLTIHSLQTYEKELILVR